MTTITLPRATVEQVLEALKDDQYRLVEVGPNQYEYKTGLLVEVGPNQYEYKTDLAIAALERALAQQAEPKPMSPEQRQRWEELAAMPQQAEPVEPVEPVDVGLLEYRGNSVAFIHQKMTAYRTGIDAAWDALRANGLHPDGKTSLADMIAKYTAPLQRKPLTEEEIYSLFRTAGSPTAFARAIERAHGIGDNT